MIDPKSFYEQILFVTLKIELLDANDALKGIGTGFLLKVDLPQDATKSLLLLVSNRHILCTNDNFQIVFHKRKADTNAPDLGQTLGYIAKDYKNALYSHPNPRIDLACINISDLVSALGSQIYFKFLDKSIFANFTEPELDVGSRIIFIGYPDNRYDQKHNLPILRSGVTASHPKMDFNGEEQFLIDAQVFPGSSGSPVFLNLKEAQYNAGQVIIGGTTHLFVGIISATMIRNNVVSPLPTVQAGIAQEVIGLGLVFKASALTSLIDLVTDQTWKTISSN
jgi:hypothetical protein